MSDGSTDAAFEQAAVERGHVALTIVAPRRSPAQRGMCEDDVAMIRLLWRT